MEYQDVKDWLDRLIFVRAAEKSYEKLNSSIQAILVTRPEIHIYKGIEIIADVMGVELDSEEKDGNTWYSFVYAGVRFFQIGSSDEFIKT